MDGIDDSIISLIDSGTINYSTIAKKLGMPLSTVHFRVRKLEKEKIIEGYKGEVNWKNAGMSVLAFIFVNVDVDLLKKLHKTQQQLLNELTGISYVKEGYIVTGEADIFLKVIAKDTEELGKVLLNSIDAKEGVVKTKTMVVL
ncbi:Lrp-AsnC family transcriptional regulator [Candidatus Mancarchaeum acidiphilum]|uniref:Lrp-AsnC family transcriptional regulator n=1 Tax=Candidatus Mancarchaeum acidiphilum TaxID=1920749 RepID=A0A218NMX5_9ARCH|nr:Lrp/AsnC family transcriptional regulator [Candidatus Mancarchaeum acidiphilum]ASI13811.1 Lrp-AsnC family transcriptional regulator [Candidatus Mancarchaeum acidiphilum]